MLDDSPDLTEAAQMAAQRVYPELIAATVNNVDFLELRTATTWAPSIGWQFHR
ncbi:MAG: hypothetical protein GIW98_03370 [Candidatus Eremiobacteraeota bacterium]|nr:hypothetical protein [Candidatus Eremiobacteraeota bacterium]